MPRSLSPATLALALAALSGACGLTHGSSASPDPAPLGRTDTEVVALLIAADSVAMLAADQALAKTQDPAIRRYAMMVKADHVGIDKSLTELLTRLGVAPLGDSLALDLRDRAEATRFRLRGLERVEFDSDYAENEVAFHMSLLAAIDEALLRGAMPPQLRALLVRVRPALEAHLGHARALAPGSAGGERA